MKEDSIVFAEESSAGLPRARARYLVQAIQLEEHSPQSVITLGVLVTIFLLASLFTFGGLTQVSEVAIADGEVIPAGLIQNVQHLEGGIVSELHVRNGDRVEAGDLLVIFATSASESELKQMLVRHVTLKLQGERLQALLEQREPHLAHSLPSTRSWLKNSALSIWPKSIVLKVNSLLSIVRSNSGAQSWTVNRIRSSPYAESWPSTGSRSLFVKSYRK